MHGTFPLMSDDVINKYYDNILLPKRGTRGSAGYDFYTPFSIELEAGGTVKIPTGIRVKIDDGWFLACVPRSSLGFKYRLQLDNTVGIIDSDYYYSQNEGHIYAKMTHCGSGENPVIINPNGRFMQGIFLPCGITYDDDVSETRNGGMGSTGRGRIKPVKTVNTPVRRSDKMEVTYSICGEPITRQELLNRPLNLEQFTDACRAALKRLTERTDSCKANESMI